MEVRQKHLVDEARKYDERNNSRAPNWPAPSENGKLKWDERQLPVRAWASIHKKIEDSDGNTYAKEAKGADDEPDPITGIFATSVTVFNAWSGDKNSPCGLWLRLARFQAPDNHWDSRLRDRTMGQKNETTGKQGLFSGRMCILQEFEQRHNNFAT